MKSYLFLFLKGVGMGAANVIPGVSGGTIALITGIFEKLIASLKAFDLEAIKLLLKFRIKELYERVNGTFLIVLFAGIGISIVSLAKLFKYLMENPTTEVWLMAFFFGLIVVSIFSVGKTINNWNTSTFISLIVGTIIAVAIALLAPANENDSFFYLFICGVIAICSMILPGLSGSFVLILLGNYKLIMLDAVSEFNFKILLPVALGAGIGLIAFSQVMGWLFEKFRDATIALMTGFIAGSLLVIWPWKEKVFLMDAAGEMILKKGKPIISEYVWSIPELDGNTAVAIGLMVVGGVALWLMERFANEMGEGEVNI
ncbi:MAG: DUF368 domain-containing protein [Bacteroidota bacterium]